MTDLTTAARLAPAAPANAAHANARCLERELDWFERVLTTRIGAYFETDDPPRAIHDLPPPDLAQDASEYARLVREQGFGFDERLVLILALIPHLRPQALDTLFLSNKNIDRGFTEFGGVKGRAHGGFLPTCETAAFILAGSDLARRFEVAALLGDSGPLRRRDIVRIEHAQAGEPAFSATLRISDEHLRLFTSGERHKPDYTMAFPAKLITTPLGWSDLVLARDTLEDVDKIRTWVEHSHTINGDWGLGRSIAPGYRSLFHGPPGTGKTLTAALIGAAVGADVYRIDLSMVISKYIGETEKNLAGVFDQARHKHWILFFDEADALFGKRTQTASAHDRYANQEIAYLLQRVEDFPGVVILATNLHANVDAAFARRFQSEVYFAMPDTSERLRLWRGIIGEHCPLAADVGLEALARDHELSGGAITNVVRYAALHALQQSRPAIRHEDLVRGIARELRKEGKAL